MEHNDRKINFVGIIDRLSEDEFGIIISDYKSKKFKTKNDKIQLTDRIAMEENREPTWLACTPTHATARVQVRSNDSTEHCSTIPAFLHKLSVKRAVWKQTKLLFFKFPIFSIF